MSETGSEAKETAAPPPILVGASQQRRFSREGFFYGLRWILAGALLGAALLGILWVVLMMLPKH